MAENDVTVKRRFLRLRLLALDRRVQDFLDTPERHARFAHFGDDTAELPDRPRHCHGIADEYEKFAERDRPACRQYGANRHHDKELAGRYDVADAPEVAEYFAERQPLSDIRLVFFVKAVRLIAFAPECPDDAHTCEVFLNMDHQFTLGFVCFLEFIPDPGKEKPGIAEDERDKAQRDNGQKHIHGEHDDQGKCH